MSGLAWRSGLRILVAAAAAWGLCACDAGPESVERAANAPATVDVSASTRRIVEGETVTLAVASRDTVGRDARVEWESTGGSLSEEENGRIARVRFDRPGTYTVTAVLLVDGVEADRDSATIEVGPLRAPPPESQTQPPPATGAGAP